MRYIILLFFLPIIACNTTLDNKELTNNSYSIPGFKKVGELRLDNQSLGGLNFMISSCTFDPKTGAGSVAFLSMGSANHFLIKVFDLESGAVQREIPIEMEGPNGVGTEITKLTLANRDSVILFNQWTGAYTLHNENGILLKKLIIAERASTETGNVGVSSLLPNHRDLFIDGMLYVPGLLPWATRSKMSEQLLVLDLFNGSQQAKVKRPELYETSMVGGINLYHLALANDPYSPILVLDFPILDQLWLYNIETEEITLVPASSKHVGEFKPLGYELNEDAYTPEDYYAHGYSQNSYFAVYFDPANSHIYRLGRIFPPGNTIQNGYSKAKYSILVLNEKKEIIDDILLDSFPRTFGLSFTGLKGLYVFNPELSEENEDVVVFDIISYRGREASNP